MRNIGLLGMLGIVTFMALGCGDQVTVTSGVCSEATACTDGLICCADNICRGVCSDEDSGFLPPEDTGNKDAGKPKDVGDKTDTGDLDSGADVPDAGMEDAASEDVPVTLDAGTDTGLTDQGYEDTPPSDVGNPDAGPEDTGNFDVGVADSGLADSGGTPDAGNPCDGYWCQSEMHCEDRAGHPTCVAGCLTDKECKDTYNGYTCTGGKCVPRYCAKDTDCWGETPYCTPSGKCGGCNASTDCGQGNVCSLGMEPTECVRAIPKICQPCNGIADCNYTLTCGLNHKCIASCMEDADCGGYKCDIPSGQSSGSCKCP